MKISKMTDQDKYLRLEGVILKHDGRYYTASARQRPGKLSLKESEINLYEISNTPNRRKDVVDFVETELFPENINIGYCNIGNHALFTWRQPSRCMSMGLSNQNFLFEREEFSPALFSSNYNYEHALGMFEGIYPTIHQSDVLSTLTSLMNSSVAFSADLAVKRVDRGLFSLKYRNMTVATSKYPFEKYSPAVPTGMFRFLEEPIDQIGIKLA